MDTSNLFQLKKEGGYFSKLIDKLNHKWKYIKIIKVTDEWSRAGHIELLVDNNNRDNNGNKIK